MDINNPFYLDVLKTLVKSKVEFILIGGLAVSFHGYSRYTGDMDLWLKPDKSNLNKLYEALLDLGYPEDIVNNIRNKREIDNPTPIKLKDDQGILKIDLMTNTFQSDFSWQECFDNCQEINLESITIPVVHINHLIQMKENSKRLEDSLKDLVDAQELKKIRQLKNK